MGHLAAHAEAGPDHAALDQTELVLLGLTDDGRIQLASHRGGDQMAGAEHAVFLVHERAHHELPAGLHARATKRRPRPPWRRPARLHVGGAAPVDAPVRELGAERRPAPRLRIASVTTSVWPSRRRLRVPFRFSPSVPMTLGRPGATVWISTAKPSRRSHASTWAGHSGLGGLGIVGPVHAGNPDEGAGEPHQLVLAFVIRAEDAL